MLLLTAIAALATPVGVWGIVLQYGSRRRDTELRDIVWMRRRTDDGFVFWHEGSAIARDVQAVVTVDGQVSTVRVDRVPAGEEVFVASSGHAENVRRAEDAVTEYREEEESRLRRAEERREEQANRYGGILQGFDPTALELPNIPPMGFSDDIHTVITWRYPSKAAGEQRFEWTERY